MTDKEKIEEFKEGDILVEADAESVSVAVLIAEKRKGKLQWQIYSPEWEVKGGKKIGITTSKLERDYISLEEHRGSLEEQRNCYADEYAKQLGDYDKYIEKSFILKSESIPISEIEEREKELTGIIENIESEIEGCNQCMEKNRGFDSRTPKSYCEPHQDIKLWRGRKLELKILINSRRKR